MIRSEKRTGTSRESRRELETLLEFLRPGDTLVVTRIDRLARSVADLQDIVRTLKSKFVSLKATDQPIDTASAAGNAFLDMLGVFAEFETSLRKERQMEGIAPTSSRGSLLTGRRASSIPLLLGHRTEKPCRQPSQTHGSRRRFRIIGIRHSGSSTDQMSSLTDKGHRLDHEVSLQCAGRRVAGADTNDYPAGVQRTGRPDRIRRFVARTCPYVRGNPAAYCRQRLRAARQGTVIASGAMIIENIHLMFIMAELFSPEWVESSSGKSGGKPERQRRFSWQHAKLPMGM